MILIPVIDTKKFKLKSIISEIQIGVYSNMFRENVWSKIKNFFMDEQSNVIHTENIQNYDRFVKSGNIVI